jgi:hypothetical protein
MNEKEALRPYQIDEITKISDRYTRLKKTFQLLVPMSGDCVQFPWLEDH